MNILIIGYCPQRFMNPVAERLQSIGHKVDLTSFTHFDISKEEAKYYNSIHNGLSTNSFFVKILHFLTGWVLYGSLMLKFLFRNNGHGFIQKFRWVLKALLNHHMTSQVRYYDLVNIQLLADYDAFFPFIQENTKVIVSYWGSDLLQASSKELAKQKKWLKKATCITVQSDEMEQVLLAKHDGLNIRPKIQKTLYPINQDIFQTIIHKIDQKKRNDKLLITIGYNASDNQNHIQILEQLDGLPNELKKGIRLFVQMSYGGTKKYLGSVERKLNTLGIDNELNTRFVSDEEIALKRIESDIFIHLPTTDAFCAALSESLIANNMVITGDWLPYSLYDQKGVIMEKVSSIELLKEKVIELLSQLDDKTEVLKNNQDLVLDIVDKERAVENWVDIFTNLD